MLVPPRVVLFHFPATGAMALAAALLPQAPVPTPPPITRPTSDVRPATVEETYGPARSEDLAEVAYNGPSYQRRNVVVRGLLEPLVADQYLALSAGTARVMLIPLQPGEAREFLGLMGRDVEVTGIVRVLGTQDPRDRGVLPALPTPRIEWPKVSITVLKVVDR